MSGIIISGQPRSGKSTLAKSFKRVNDALGCNVDAKFFKIINDYKIFTKDFDFTENLKNLINQRVYQDSRRKITTTLLDETGVSFPVIASKIGKKNYLRAEKILLDFLDTSCKLKKKKFWVLPDLGAEAYFEKLIKIKKDLYVIFLFRNPLESIVSSLYWRSYPNKSKNLLELIVRWNISYLNAKKLKQKYPKLINIYFYNEIERMSRVNDWFYKTFNTKLKFKYAKKKTFFSYSKSKWLSPEGKYEKLLKKEEINLIFNGCVFDFKFPLKINKIKNLSFKILYIRLLTYFFVNLSKVNRFNAFKFLNFYFSPFNIFSLGLKKIIKNFFLNKKLL